MTDEEIMAIARPLGLVRGYYDENGITPNQIYAFANAVRNAALEEFKPVGEIIHGHPYPFAAEKKVRKFELPEGAIIYAAAIREKSSDTRSTN